MDKNTKALYVSVIIIGIAWGITFTSFVSIYSNNEVLIKLVTQQNKIIEKLQDYEINGHEQAVMRLNTMDSKGNSILEKGDFEMWVYKKTSDGEPILLGVVFPHEIQSLYVDLPLFFELHLNSTNHYIDTSSIVSNLKIEEITFDDYDRDGKYSFIVEIADPSHLYDLQVYLEREKIE